MIIKEQFNDYEKSIMTYQDHALAINEFKSNGVKEISIDTYLNLLDSIVNFLFQFGDCLNQYETTITNQQEQIDSLLDHLKNSISV